MPATYLGFPAQWWYRDAYLASFCRDRDEFVSDFKYHLEEAGAMDIVASEIPDWHERLIADYEGDQGDAAEHALGGY